MFTGMMQMLQCHLWYYILIVLLPSDNRYITCNECFFRLLLFGFLLVIFLFYFNLCFLTDCRIFDSFSAAIDCVFSVTVSLWLQKNKLYLSGNKNMYENPGCAVKVAGSVAVRVQCVIQGRNIGVTWTQQRTTTTTDNNNNDDDKKGGLERSSVISCINSFFQ